MLSLAAAATLALSVGLGAVTPKQTPTASTQRAPPIVMMPPKPKIDKRTWLPKRASRFGRELDAAMQVVSRACAVVTPTDGSAAAGLDAAAAELAAQAVVCGPLAAEFADDAIVATPTAAAFDALDGAVREGVLAAVNEVGATTPCVNEWGAPEAVPSGALDDAALAKLLAGVAQASPKVALGEGRVWLLSPVLQGAQPGVSLALLCDGEPVVGVLGLTALPRNFLDRTKLLRMDVAFDGQVRAAQFSAQFSARFAAQFAAHSIAVSRRPAPSLPQVGAIVPADGTLLWAEAGVGSYERQIGGLHGSDVRVRVDRSRIGSRAAVPDLSREEWEAASAGGGIGAPPPLSEAVRCALDGAQERSDALVTALGLPKEAPLVVPHPLVGYAAVARGEAQLFVDLPPPGEFNAHAWAHAAGALIVHEAGGRVTDAKNNDVDHFSAASKIGDADADGLVVSNVDLHPPVVRTLMEA